MSVHKEIEDATNLARDEIKKVLEKLKLDAGHGINLLRSIANELEHPSP